MKLEAKLSYDTVRFDRDNDAHLVVTLSAPEQETQENQRPQLCIVPLIDVSPSMEGAKLLYAKRSLIKLIDNLSANDYCGLIAFSSVTQLLSRPVRCTPEAKEELRRKVQSLTLSGATNIADALLEGFRVANGMDLPTEVITRVILFTDGAANTGPAKSPQEILALVEPNIGIATVSAFGYGADAVQSFLSDLSKAGNGNYSFVQNPDDALTAFGKELGGLLSTYATNLVINVNPLAGHTISSVVTDIEADEEDTGQVRLRVPDILAGETRHFVLAVKLREQKSAFPREVNVFHVQVGFETLDAARRREHGAIETNARLRFVRDGEHQEKPSADLDRIIGLAQVVRAQLEAEVHAKRGDFGNAQNVMDTISEQVRTRGLVDLGKVASNIGGRVSSSVQYAGSLAYLTSVTRGATRGFSGTYCAAAVKDLGSVGVAFSNSSQSSVAASFADAGTAVPMIDGSYTGGFDPNQAFVSDAPLQTIPGGWETTTVVVDSSSGPTLGSTTDTPVVETKKRKQRKSKISQKTQGW